MLSCSPVKIFFPFLFHTSGLVRHQCCVFCRRHGAFDADSDSGGVHALSGGLLQCLWTLPGRRHEEAEPACWGQQRRGRQEERWKPLWQGWWMCVWCAQTITVLHMCYVLKRRWKKRYRQHSYSIPLKFNKDNVSILLGSRELKVHLPSKRVFVFSLSSSSHSSVWVKIWDKTIPLK